MLFGSQGILLAKVLAATQRTFIEPRQAQQSGFAMKSHHLAGPSNGE